MSQPRQTRRWPNILRKKRACANECTYYMKTSLRWIIRLAAFIVITSVGWMRANGQAPSGNYEYTLKAQDGFALWNFSGAYSWPFYDTLQLHQDAKGRLTAIIEEGGPTNVALVGAVTGSGSRLKMQLRSTTGLPEYLLDRDLMAMRKDKLSLKFDALTRALTGTDHISD